MVSYSLTHERCSLFEFGSAFVFVLLPSLLCSIIQTVVGNFLLTACFIYTMRVNNSHMFDSLFFWIFFLIRSFWMLIATADRTIMTNNKMIIFLDFVLIISQLRGFGEKKPISRLKRSYTSTILLPLFQQVCWAIVQNDRSKHSISLQTLRHFLVRWTLYLMVEVLSIFTIFLCSNVQFEKIIQNALFTPALGLSRRKTMRHRI